MKRRAATWLLLAAISACHAPARAPATHRALGAGTLQPSFAYLTGTSGTVTLQGGYYASDVRMHASSAGTFTVAPGIAGAIPALQPVITVPSGTSFVLGQSTIGSAIADGSVLNFSGDTYGITLWRYAAGAVLPVQWPLYVSNVNGQYSEIPNVIKLADGRLFGTWLTSAGPGQQGQSVAVWSTSSNGGATWAAPTTFISDPTYSIGNASVTQLANGSLIATYFLQAVGGAETPLLHGVYVVSSSNLGVTWGAPVNVVSAATTWEAICAPVVQIGNGNLVLPIYTNYGGADSSEVMISTDGGATWPTEALIRSGDVGGYNFDEVNVGLLANGTLLALMRADAINVVQMTSTDGGHTWGSYAISGIAGQSAPHFVQLASGRIVVVQREIAAGEVTAVSYSLDNAATWSPLVALPSLVAGQSQYGYPVELTPGIVGVLFTVNVSSTQAVVQFTVLPETAT